jgi:hypothetical protein
VKFYERLRKRFETPTCPVCGLAYVGDGEAPCLPCWKHIRGDVDLSGFEAEV